MFISDSIRFEHGWPFVYLVRVVGGQPGTESRPPFLVWSAWRTTGQILQWRPLNLLGDTALILVMAAAVSFLTSKWRRMRPSIFQVRFSDIILFTILLAAGLSALRFCNAHFQKQSKIIKKYDDSLAVFGMRCVHPPLISRLIGEGNIPDAWELPDSMSLYSFPLNEFSAAIQDASKISTITEISIDLGQDPIEKLRQLATFRRLEVLEVFFPNDSTVGAEELKAFDQLKELWIYADFDEQLLAIITEALPGCHVEFSDAVGE